MIIIIYIFNVIKDDFFTIPECSTILNLDISDNQTNLKGYYLLSIIPNGDNVSFVMNGSVKFNDEKYIISRKFLIDYKPRGEHFFAHIKDISIDPSDQAGDDIYIRGVPKINQIYFAKIKKIDGGNYIFEENSAPLFICNV